MESRVRHLLSSLSVLCIEGVFPVTPRCITLVPVVPDETVGIALLRAADVEDLRVGIREVLGLTHARDVLLPRDIDAGNLQLAVALASAGAQSLGQLGHSYAVW